MTAAARVYPSLIDVEPGRDAYTSPPIIQSYAKQSVASWWLHGQCVSVRLPGNVYLKNLLAFPDHAQNADAFYALLDECLSRECKRPSGYPAPFHSNYKSHAVPWTVNAMFAPRFAGGWQEALKVGQFPGPHLRYDIRSAYLSALSDWLPDPATYSYSDDLRDGGLYVIEHEPIPGLPYPFNAFPVVNATPDEIEVYGLKVKRILRGVKWAKTISTDPIRETLMSFSFWKQAARAYWGRWAMIEQVECATVSNRWKLPSRFANLPWAHLIVSRVRMQLWHEVIKGDVLHVYVDSIICRDNRRIDPYKIGAWKLEHVYTDGVRIAGPGHYGALNGPAEKWAGLRKDDPRRNFASDQYGRIPAA